MNRRAFLSALSGSLLAAPRAAEAKQAGRAWLVGYLAPGDRVAPIMDAFYVVLRERGYVICRDIVVEERFTDATPGQLLAAARELISGAPS